MREPVTRAGGYIRDKECRENQTRREPGGGTGRGRFDPSPCLFIPKSGTCKSVAVACRNNVLKATAHTGFWPNVHGEGMHPRVKSRTLTIRGWIGSVPTQQKVIRPYVKEQVSRFTSSDNQVLAWRRRGGQAESR